MYEQGDLTEMLMEEIAPTTAHIESLQSTIFTPLY